MFVVIGVIPLLCTFVEFNSVFKFLTNRFGFRKYVIVLLSKISECVLLLIQNLGHARILPVIAVSSNIKNIPSMSGTSLQLLKSSNL